MLAARGAAWGKLPSRDDLCGRSQGKILQKKGSFKMPRRKSRPVKVSRPQKDRSRLKGGIPLDELLIGTPCICGELRLSGSNESARPSSRSCDDVVERGESTDRTNGNRTDS